MCVALLKIFSGQIILMFHVTIKQPYSTSTDRLCVTVMLAKDGISLAASVRLCVCLFFCPSRNKKELPIKN